MAPYRQLTPEIRYGLYLLLKPGPTPSPIAEILGVHQSTSRRELRRNVSQRGYRYQQAHKQAIERR